ncbi:MAG: hypothetical protein HYS53_00205 [Candidatus Aenigmarchaeota archaeon]|nr:hypothetical protein [Candidatus Aenigmarchaeota archaeon]
MNAKQKAQDNGRSDARTRFAGFYYRINIIFPQVWLSWKTKKTNDLSWMTITIGMLNGFLWTAYGALKRQLNFCIGTLYV